MNSVVFTINGVNFSKNVVFSVKWSQLLDERLDEAEIFLKNVKREKPFTPLDLAILTINNAPSSPLFDYKPVKEGVTQTLTDGYLSQQQTMQFVVANDKVENYPVGSEFYKHTLYLVEVTKYLERYVLDSLYFSNSRDISYAATDSDAYIRFIEGLPRPEYDGFNSLTEGSIKEIIDGKIKFPSLADWYDEAQDSASPLYPLRLAMEAAESADDYAVYIYDNHGDLIYFETSPSADLWTKQIELTTGESSYRVKYEYCPNHENTANAYYSVFEVYFSAVKNTLRPKLWTVADAITRVCELALPIRYNDTTVTGFRPRFILSGASYSGMQVSYEIGTQAAELDKVMLPENFTLTKCTLREALQQIGHIIHAEPRATVATYGGVKYYTISYDRYGANKLSYISNKKYISRTASQDIENYCRAVDSTVDNLVSSISYLGAGTVVDPYRAGAISLRTEITTARIEDGSAFIPTKYAIQEIEKLEASVLTNPTTFSPFNDVTKYLFEKDAYDNLSAYDGYFPYARQFAIYYTQGSKNIGGLWFKTEHPISDIFNDYAIVNILKDCGIMPYTGSGHPYPQMRFRITYKPRFGQRVRQYKSEMESTPLEVIGNPSTLIYNQSANLVETRYYGENLKGVVERLGNVEKVLTYRLAYLSDIPTAGELFDEDYYISAVSCELTPSDIKCTVALSKDFNRLSQFIGINSINRMYEVSEKQAISRDSIYCETCLITENIDSGDSGVITNKRALTGIAKTVAYLSAVAEGENPSGEKATAVTARFYDKQRNAVTPYFINLPVVATAQGNAITFTFAFEDNYSAGQKSVYVENSLTGDDNSGYFGTYVPYSDKFGRGYYLRFAIQDTVQNAPDALSIPQQNSTGNAGYLFRTGDDYIVYRKIGEETPSISFQVNFRTDSKLIIGSGLAKNCPLVVGDPAIHQNLRVYYFTERISKFAGKLNVSAAIGYRYLTIKSGDFHDNYFILSEDTTNANNDDAHISNAVAWAIVSYGDTRTYSVRTEDGAQITQEVEEGYDVIIAKNSPTFNPLRFCMKTDKE